MARETHGPGGRVGLLRPVTSVCHHLHHHHYHRQCQKKKPQWLLIFGFPVNRQMAMFLLETVLSLKYIHNLSFVCIPCLIILIWCKYYWERSILPLREGGLLIPLLWRQQEQWKDTNGPQFHILHYQIPLQLLVNNQPKICSSDIVPAGKGQGYLILQNICHLFWAKFFSYCKVGKSSKREKKIEWGLLDSCQHVRYWQNGILSKEIFQDAKHWQC